MMSWKSSWTVGLGQRKIMDKTRHGSVWGNCHLESYLTKWITKLIICIKRKRDTPEPSCDTVFLLSVTWYSYKQIVWLISWIF